MWFIRTKLYKFLLLVFLLSCITNYTWSQSKPPQINAIGNSFFCPSTEQQIVTSFSISNPDNIEITKLFIQISEGYISSQDRLKLNGSHPVSATFNISEGKLTLSSSKTGSEAVADLENAVKDVYFTSSNSVPGEKKFSFTINEKNYLPSTGHYYEYISAAGITWSNAKIAAQTKDYYGLIGYLATITSLEEAQLAGEQATGQGWIGGSDDDVEGTWKWVTGPEAGKSFWIGGINGTTNGTDISPPFAYWSSNEPNDWPNSGIQGEENYAHVYDNGRWNDYPNSNSSISGYIVEYGGMSGDPVVDFGINETTLKVAEITNLIAPAPICGSGKATISATSNTGFVLWFDALTGGTNLGGGDTYISPSPISTSTSYYALASSDGICETGVRTKIDVIVNVIPTITNISEDTLCENGIGTLSATASAGEINWYTSLTGGSALFTGSNFTTPVLNNTTTYYVDATDNGCVTTVRKPITVTVVHLDAPTTAKPEQHFCDIENATLTNLSINGTAILWYANATSTTALTSSEDLKNNTTYFASQTINGCESAARLAIKVFIYEMPETIDPIEKIGVCDSNSFGTDTDGIEFFNLTQRESSILNGKNAANFNIYYYSDAALSVEITNTSNYKNTTIGGPQTIYFKIENKNLTKCSVTSSFEIEVYKLPVIINSEVTLEQCDNDETNDGFSVFNLNEANELISADYQNETFKFYRDAAYTNLIEDPIAYENPSVINSSVFVKIKTINNCERFAKINLKVGATQIPSDFHLEYYLCEDYPSNDQDGSTTFNFSDAEQKLIDTKPLFSSQEVRISYFESLEDALSEINAIPDISNYKNTTPWEQEIYIRIDSDDVNACLGLNHVITLYVEPLPVANPVTIDRQCDDDQDGLFPFDVSTIEETVRNEQTDITISYFDEAGNSLPSPLPNPFLTKSQVITIKVENSTSTISPACFDETTLEFIVNDAPEIYPVIIEPLCDDGEDTTDGFSSFDTSTIETKLLGGQTSMEVFYFDSNNNPLPSPLPNPFITKTQVISVEIQNPINPTCSISTTLNFVVNPLPSFEVLPEQILCLNTPPTVLEPINPDGNYTYEWFDSNGSIVSNQTSYPTFEGGFFTVIATSNLGCESLPRTIFVEKSDVANIDLDDLTIVDDSNNNTITINDANNNLGDDDYEYSLNDEFGPFQDEPYFDNVPAGLHILYVRDTDNCGTVPLEVSIIGYPKFFTPNNDGKNDTWNIIGISSEYYPNSLLNIFDRFGKLVAQINPNMNGWDGFYNNKELPSTDYWFTVELTDKTGKSRSKQGHFSLIRR
ncbi:Ig-like domain-containing protein [Lutibacter flavus]|uniref:Gliding motility-associated C-terminal domain-containing protein n=1 Tax=Lutibacter flavus TaxID=691689 RepID=A0A238X5W3_9FLAO|nr:T9SS type B sorting domain-containing protein [Lutibacter flavus]SNR54022.1 gliding motility-associated C-terminal domain-containing protein [Lutibacter flavus]